MACLRRGTSPPPYTCLRSRARGRASTQNACRKRRRAPFLFRSLRTVRLRDYCARPSRAWPVLLTSSTSFDARTARWTRWRSDDDQGNHILRDHHRQEGGHGHHRTHRGRLARAATCWATSPSSPAAKRTTSTPASWPTGPPLLWGQRLVMLAAIVRAHPRGVLAVGSQQRSPPARLLAAQGPGHQLRRADHALRRPRAARPSSSTTCCT